MKFFDDLDRPYRKALKDQLRDLWSHTSTAIEGNTLTLEETQFVIEEGLTVKGKPLKHHNEVIGHARAIDLIYDMVRKETVTQEDLFSIHRAVMTEVVIDVYSPVGAWKNQANGVNFLNENGKRGYLEFPSPQDTPGLMTQWLTLFNELNRQELSREEAVGAYATLHVSFTTVHPFFDGNGRCARLLSNIPVLKSGHPPIIISQEDRPEYIKLLRGYQLKNGIPKAGDSVIVPSESLEDFREFCDRSWSASLDLVDQMRRRQEEKDRENGLLDIVTPVPDPEQRREILNRIRFIHSHEKIRNLTKDSLNRMTNQENRLIEKRRLDEVERQISEGCRKADKFIKGLGLPAEIQKGLIGHLKRYEKSTKQSVER